MKTKYLYILVAMWCLAIFACQKDDTVKIELSQPNIVGVPSEGATYDIKVGASDTWIVKEEAREWIRLARYASEGEQYLKIEVESNISEQTRNTAIELVSRNSMRVLTIQQEGKPVGQELKYRLPVVFHVLHYDAANSEENIPREQLYQTLREVNELYAKNNLNLEFYPANIDPSGNVMSEAGINRVRWVAESINPIEVMTEEDNEYLHLLWDPNKYINILMYPFTIPNILGIATFPLTPEHSPMTGLESVKFSNLQVSDIKQLRGVSINSSWYKDQDVNTFKGYVDDALLKRQVSIATTVAHELGHYLGLRHVFSEGADGSCIDTDYCEDTPSYNKHREYDSFVAEMMSDARYNPNFKDEFKWEALFQRTTCSGETFVSRNIMDYAYSYMDTFSAQQKERIRHVLNYSPFVPGPKKAVVSTVRSAVPLKPTHIPHSIVICRASESWADPK